MRRWITNGIAVAAIAVAAFGLAACGGDDGASAADTAATGLASGEPIKIGWVRADSGFMNFYDGPVSAAAEIKVKEINDAGGIDGRPLEIEYADYKTDVNLVDGATQKLIDDGAEIIVTPCDYTFAAPAATLANQNGIFNLGCAGSTLFGLEGLGPLTFNTWHGNPTEAAVISDFMTEQGFTNVYFMQDLTIDYTKEVCDLTQKRFTANGGTVAGTSTFQNDDPSFSSQIADLRKSDADAVLICSIIPGGATMMKQIRSAGIDIPIVGSAGGLGGSFWLKSVPGINNVYLAGEVGSIYGDDPSPERNAFVEKFTEATGAAPQLGHAFTGYSTIEALATALERTEGSTDGTAIAEQFSQFTDEPLLVGKTTYTADCHVPYGRALTVTKLVNGKPQFQEEITPVDVERVGC